MKVGSFVLHQPATVEEAVSLLATLGDDAKVLAGGQSLVPLMSLRLAVPGHLVDINNLGSELSYVRRVDDGVLIGALTRHATLERTAFDGGLSVIAQGARHIGHLPIRLRGTIGGSLVHSDPSAELPMIAALLDTTLVLAHMRGERMVNAQDFFVMPFVSALEPDEILTEVRIQAPPPGTQAVFKEVSRRVGDYALAAVAALAHTAEDGTCDWARIAIAGLGGKPRRALVAEQQLMGKPLNVSGDAGARLAEQVAALATADLEPAGDVQVSAEYRTHLAGVLVGRCVRELTAA